MEYNGFISTLINRSEDILDPRQDDKFEVTRLLLLLNTAFALVFNRINDFDNSPDDSYMRPISRNILKNRLLDRRINLEVRTDFNSSIYFENFMEEINWRFIEVRKDLFIRKKVSARDIAALLDHGAEIDRATLTWYRLLSALRNSFAHGGIFPMSPDQAGYKEISGRGSRIFLKPNDIDRVYFVSRLTDGDSNSELGKVLIAFGLDSLRDFWEGWRAFLKAECDLERLDVAA
jgi:hypothetical protein